MLKKLLLASTLIFSIQVAAKELKDLFPFTCALVVEHISGERYLHPITYKDERYLSFGVYPVSDANSSKFEFLYAGNDRFRVQYRRMETNSEKYRRLRIYDRVAEIAREIGDLNTAQKFTTGMNRDRKLIVDFAEEYVSVDELASGKEYRFTTPELPGTALACQKDPAWP